MVSPIKNFPNRVYVIDPEDPTKNVDGSARNKSISKGEDGKELPSYLQPSKKTREKNEKSQKTKPQASKRARVKSQKKTQPRKKPVQPSIPLACVYFAGPLSTFGVSRGPDSRLWSALSLSSVVLGVAALSIWVGAVDWNSQNSPGGALTIIMAIAAVITGFSAWGRAVLLAGRYESSRLKRTPEWMKRPLAAGLLGMIFPGMGLFVNGRPKQAAAALASACLTIISLIFISRGLWMWNFNLQAGVFAVGTDFLEHLLIFSCLTAALGCLVWIVQALNGVRVAAGSSGRKPAYVGNWAAIALLIAAVAFSAFSKPAEVAKAFDIGATITRGEGMKIIPLRLSLAAIRFDPSRPGYFVKAIGFYEECGDQLAADDMRRELIDRLMPTVPLLEEEGLLGAGNGTGAGLQRAAEVALGAAQDDAMLDGAEPVRTLPAELMTLDWNMKRENP